MMPEKKSPESLAIAYNIMKKNRRKMSAGGEVYDIEHFGKKAEEHEELSEPSEVMEYASPSKEDEPDDMYTPKGPYNFAQGGMFHPKALAEKVRMHKMAAGGEVESDDFLSDEMSHESMPHEDSDQPVDNHMSDEDEMKSRKKMRIMEAMHKASMMK